MVGPLEVDASGKLLGRGEDLLWMGDVGVVK